jgi:DNA polymerase-3 subunit epsilon
VLRWLVDPGVPIPEAAVAVHGLTGEHVRAHGTAPAPAVAQMARALAAGPAAGLPLVVMNAPFDLTLLDRELRRHNGTALADHWPADGLCVLDPRVLDKYADRYRKGRRTLTDLCAHYGVPLLDAHDAAADAMAALSLVRAIGRAHADGRIGTMTTAELHLRQTVWHAAQARGLQEWFARSGSPERCDPFWPLRPRLPDAA